jgi:phage gpG-like protein
VAGNATEQVNARLQALRAAAAGPAALATVRAMSLLGVAVTMEVLSQRAHGEGEPAGPAGEPPSVVSGTLRRSVKATPPQSLGPGRAGAAVGSSVVYARIQEFGGVIEAKGGMLHWTDGSGAHFAKRVELPARPYLHPAIQLMVGSGRLREVAAKAWLAALEGA